MELDAYRQFAELEENHWWFRARRRIFFHLLERMVPRRDDARVLDLGCGAGGMLAPLARFGRVHGLELHRDTAQLARERTAMAIVRANAYALPYAADSHDLVCLFDTIEHVPEEARALREIHRVTKPGGWVFFSVPAYAFLWTNNDRVAHHCRRYTRGRLEAALAEAGFECVRSSYFNALLFPAILPALLIRKAVERFIGLRDPNATNLTVETHPLLAELLFRIMSSERHWLARAGFPAGHSILALVRKP